MKFYVHPTDQRWYNFLRQEPQQDVNFWKPKATTFKALPPNGYFLFLLNKPNRFIVGGGCYAGKINATVDEAWNIFGVRNGVSSREEFRRILYGNKYAPKAADAPILCLTLNAPVFFEPADWIAPPEGWSDSLVQGRSYDISEPMGLHLWQRVQPVLDHYRANAPLFLPTVPSLVLEPAAQYRPVLVRPEQQSFRSIIAQAYDRKCAISGEKTVPVLEAAHIRPYAAAGPSIVGNGLLLRSDLHRLFDSHYLTVNAEDMQVMVSSRIRKEFSNGVEYYKFDGCKLRSPKEAQERPMREYLQYHNTLFMP